MIDESEASSFELTLRFVASWYGIEALSIPAVEVERRMKTGSTSQDRLKMISAKVGECC
jgi:hypothetical protein